MRTLLCVREDIGGLVIQELVTKTPPSGKAIFFVSQGAEIVESGPSVPDENSSLSSRRRFQ